MSGSGGADDERGDDDDGRRRIAGAGERPERRKARALGDSALLAEMRAGDAWAWGEFVVRFQPLLLDFARRIGIPAEDRATLVDDVLTDEAMRLTAERRAARAPEQLGAYLMRATRNRHLRAKRGQARRSAHYADATVDAGTGAREAAIVSACSQHSLRLVREPALPDEERDGEGSPALTRGLALLVAALRGTITADEEQLLGWHGAQVPHREIAGWLGVSYDAATKRIWRLAKRLRAQSTIAVAGFPPAEREALRRFFARADVAIEDGATRDDRRECAR